MIKKISGSPKDPVPGSSSRRIPAFAKKFEDEKGEKVTFMPAKEAEPEVRVAYICKGDIVRFEAPNMLALNFLLSDSLGGGGSESLLTDAQGKTHGLALLEMEFER